METPEIEATRERWLLEMEALVREHGALHYWRFGEGAHDGDA